MTAMAQPFDNKRAAQVWQRVHAQPGAPGQEAARVLALIPQLHQCAGLCRQISGASGTLQQLSRDLAAQTAALSGIYSLMTGEKPALPPVKVRSRARDAALRACYTQQLRCLTEYQALCGLSDFSAAFQAMAELGQQVCFRLLQLLGGGT